jgi:dolichol kinase
MEKLAPPPSQPPLRIPRRLFHLAAASLLPLAALLFPQPVAIGLAATAAASLLLWEAARHRMPSLNGWFLDRFSGLFKPEERQRITGATYLAVASVATLVFFSPTVAALALMFVAMADPVAALVGIRYGRHRLLVPATWRSQGPSPKSIEGSLAFLTTALGVALLLRSIGVYGTLWPAALGALTAAVTEVAPLPTDDNLTVPLASGTVMALLWAG